MMMSETIKPGLFGQKHSSRDYTKEANWGKNIFNSSFPASLVAYMSAKGVNPVYLCVDENNNLIHEYISGADLFGIDPLSDNASWRLLHSPELTHPRIGKNEIKNIILGGGQNLLSPERRFDAVIVNSPDLFD